MFLWRTFVILIQVIQACDYIELMTKVRCARGVAFVDDVRTEKVTL